MSIQQDVLISLNQDTEDLLSKKIQISKALIEGFFFVLLYLVFVKSSMKIHLGIFLFFLLISSTSIAGKIDKAFACLKEMNYFEAKKLFYESLKKKEVPASYGLSTIFYRKDNPFHNIDSAYKYISIAEAGYVKMLEEDKAKFALLGMNYDSILQLREKIGSFYYQIALSKNSEVALTEFMEKYPWSKENQLSVVQRDSLIFQKAIRINKSNYYDSILKNYPTIKYKEELIDRYELTFFSEQTNSGTITDYVRFINENPKNKYLPEAMDALFRLETQSNTIEDYARFIQLYPNNSNIDKAWRKLYALYMVEFSDDRVKKFKKEYPNYPFKDDLKRDQDLSKLTLYPFKRGKLFGWMNQKGIEIYTPEYETLNLYSEGLALAQKNGLYGYVDKLNNVAIPFQFDLGSDFINGRAIVEKGGKSGVINRAGKYILPLEFNELGQYTEGLIYGTKDSLYAYYDLMGKQITESKFSDVFPFVKGKAKVVIHGKEAFIDSTGSYISEPMHKEIFYFNDSLLIYRDSILYGIKTVRNRVVLKPTYEYISPLSNDRAIFVLSNKLGFIDEQGKKVIKNMFDLIPNYKQLCIFHDGYARVRIKGKYALIDKLGNYVLKPDYTGLGDVSKLISFSKGKQWGYINLEDKSVSILPIFDYASSYHYGLAIVDVKSLQGVINEKAKWIIPAIFTSISLIAENFYLVSNGAKYGLYSLSGEQLIPLEYDQIRMLNKDLLLLYNGDDMHYYSLMDRKLIQDITKNE